MTDGAGLGAGLDATRTGRYRGALAVAAVVAALGALAGTPVLLVAAVVVAVVPALGRASEPPEPDVVVDRVVRPPDPAPGETATVEFAARNAGDARLADVRVVDAPPDGVDVVDGSRALAAALAPDESATATYEVAVPAGEHAFDDPFVAVHDATGSVAVTGRVTVDETTVASTAPLPDVEAVTVAPPASGRPGRRPSDDAGDGISFDSLREYRRGDPAARVDWRRYARTGDLATVRYRERRAPTVMLLVDARERAHLAAAADAEDAETAESAIRRGVTAARRIVGGFDLAHVGVVALAPEYPTLDPGVGREHAHRLRAFLDAVPGVAGAPEPLDADGRDLAAGVRARLPRNAQVCLCTPACDDAVVDAATHLAAAGHDVGVCSPDPTARTDAGGRLAALERRARLRALRRRGITVVDWGDEPLATAFDRSGWTT
ncbi:DUF58 domain-containing protein [Halorubellus litoreus]|uniref:DUF58 domain-containing protein n=1 Tax=Halorubellus litoreus TaxID=755308 RepID=A0ABD5VNF6_9EURY